VRDLFRGRSPFLFINGGELGITDLTLRAAGLDVVFGTNGPIEDIPSHKPFFLSTITDSYSKPRRNPPKRSPRDTENLRAKIWGSHDLHQSQRYQNTFKDAALVFIPGLLNFFPGDDFFNRASAFFGHGGLIIGVSKNDTNTSHHGLYSVVGGDSRVLQPDWRTELVLVVKRLTLALRDPRVEASTAKELVFVGHSKGGLLVQALSALAKIADKGNAGSRLHDLKKKFPGLNTIPLADILYLGERLSNAQFYLYGSPIEGIERRGVVSVFDNLLLKGSANHFTPDFIRRFFEDLDHSPLEANAIIHAQKAPTLSGTVSVDKNHPTLFSGVLTRAARVLFHGAAHLIGAEDGDGLVATPNAAHWPNLRFLPSPADHIQMVETGAAAQGLLHLLDDHALPSHAANLHSGALTMAQQLVGSSPELQKHLAWLFAHNPSKAVEVREGINGQLPRLLIGENQERLVIKIDELRKTGSNDAAEGLELVASQVIDRNLPLTPLIQSMGLLPGLALH